MSHAQPTSCRRATALAAAALCTALCHAHATARETRVLLANPFNTGLRTTYDRLGAPVLNDRGQVALVASRQSAPNVYTSVNLLQWSEGSGAAVLAGLGPQFSFLYGDLTQNNLGDVGFMAKNASSGKDGIYLSSHLGDGPVSEVGGVVGYSHETIVKLLPPTMARTSALMVYSPWLDPGDPGKHSFALVGGVPPKVGAYQGGFYQGSPFVTRFTPLNAAVDPDSETYQLASARHVVMADNPLNKAFSGEFGRSLDGISFDIQLGAVFFTDPVRGKLYEVVMDGDHLSHTSPWRFRNLASAVPALAVGRGQFDGAGLAFAADLANTPNGAVNGQGIYRFLSASNLGPGPLPYGANIGNRIEVARTGTAAPGGGTHLRFDKQVFINDSLQVAYSGEVSARPRTSPALPKGHRHGSIFIDRTDVVDEGQAAPTASGAPSGTFGQLTLKAFNNAGVALFSAMMNGEGSPVNFGEGAFLGDGREIVEVVRKDDVLSGTRGKQVLLFALSANPMNNHGQVAYGVTFSDGTDGTYLFTPTLHWRDPGSALPFAPPLAWDNAKHWTLGLAPADVHDVRIDPDFKVSIKGPGTDRTVRSLDVGTGAGAVQLALQPGVQLTVLEGGLHVGARGTLTGSGTVVGSLVNDGLVRPTYLAVTNTITNHARIEGGGYLQGSLANGSTGTVNVGVGEHMTVIGTGAGPSTNRAHQNFGAITVGGGALTMVGGLGNQGTLHATDASLAFVGRGLLNHGSVVLDGTRVDVVGEVVNAADGRIATGAGTLAVFHDHVRNAGEIDLGTTDAAQLIGGLDLTGTSHLSFVLGAAAVPGTAMLTADGRVDLAGLLAVAFGNGVAPHAGDDFHVFDWSGANVHGSFASFVLPDLGVIGNWDTSDLLVGGWLNIAASHQAAAAMTMWSGDELAAGRVAMDVAAVPEPGTWALMLGGMLAVGVLQRRRRQET